MFVSVAISYAQVLDKSLMIGRYTSYHVLSPVIRRLLYSSLCFSLTPYVIAFTLFLVLGILTNLRYAHIAVDADAHLKLPVHVRTYTNTHTRTRPRR
jgi:hypothetical protein